jgi:hypothetical protein
MPTVRRVNCANCEDCTESIDYLSRGFSHLENIDNDGYTSHVGYMGSFRQLHYNKSYLK